MTYTFQALIGFNSGVMQMTDQLELEHHVRIRYRDEDYITSRKCMLVTRNCKEPAHLPEWQSFYLDVKRLARGEEIYAIGLVCGPLVYPVRKSFVRGHASGFRETQIGNYWYSIEIGTGFVPERNLGLFLTKDKNEQSRREAIDREQWEDFISVAARRAEYFRQVTKLHQMRRTKNSKLADRLFREVLDIAEKLAQ